MPLLFRVNITKSHFTIDWMSHLPFIIFFDFSTSFSRHHNFFSSVKSTERIVKRMLRAANNTRSSDNVQLKLAYVGRNLNCGRTRWPYKVNTKLFFFQINKILPECMGIVILIACRTGTIFVRVFQANEATSRRRARDTRGKAPLQLIS